MKDEKKPQTPITKQEVPVVNTEQAPLELVNLVAQGVPMLEAKKRLGIK